MISIIVCSATGKPHTYFSESLQNTIGTTYELIVIDNATGKYSISQAYNIGLKQAKYDYIVFCHEDIEFLTQNWGYKLIAHLNTDRVGICGIAGGRLATHIPEEAWKGYDMSTCMWQGNGYNKETLRFHKRPKNYSLPRRSAVCLDGSFLAMRADTTQTVHFDNDLPGFHAYDIDICLNACSQGFINYVIYDIQLVHYSRGNITRNYYESLARVYEKWEQHLPLIANGLEGNHKQIIKRQELHRLNSLCKQWVRVGFTNNEIIALLQKFRTYDLKPLNGFQIFLTRIRLKCILLNSKLRHKMLT